MKSVWLLFVVCSLPSVTARKLAFLLTAPSELHLGALEPVTLQLLGVVDRHQKPVLASVYLKDYVRGVEASEPYKIFLNFQNNFTTTFHMMISQRAGAELELWQRRRSGIPYVLLVAEVSEEKGFVHLPLAPSSSLMIIQSDQQSYSVGERVRYRVLMFDQSISLYPNNITVTMQNSEGNVVSIMHCGFVATYHGSFTIPPDAASGQWTLFADATNKPIHTSSAKFQVKSDEHRRLNVKIVSDEGYCPINKESISFTVLVESPTMQPFTGHLALTFTVSDHSGKRYRLPRFNEVNTVRDGRLFAVLRMQQLLDNMEKIGSLDQFMHGSLHVIANILENADLMIGSGEIELPFARSPYTIPHSKSKQYFIPGAIYSMQTSLIHPDGTMAPGIPLNVSVTISGKEVTEGMSITESDRNGDVNFDFEVPKDSESITIMMNAADTSRRQTTEVWAIQKKHSANGNYLHVSVPHTRIYPGDTLVVSLTAISQVPKDETYTFSVMVLARKKLLMFENITGRSKTEFLINVTQEMVPALNIIAYYFREQHDQREIVADYVHVDVTSLCEAEFEIDPVLRGEHIHLSVSTKRDIEIFVQAVDPSKTEETSAFGAITDQILEYFRSPVISANADPDEGYVFQAGGRRVISDFLSSPLLLKTKCFLETAQQTVQDFTTQVWPREAFRRRAKRHVITKNRGSDVQPIPDQNWIWNVNVPTGKSQYRLLFDGQAPTSIQFQAVIFSPSFGVCEVEPKLIEFGL